MTGPQLQDFRPAKNGPQHSQQSGCGWNIKIGNWNYVSHATIPLCSPLFSCHCVGWIVPQTFPLFLQLVRRDVFPHLVKDAHVTTLSHLDRRQIKPKSKNANPIWYLNPYLGGDLEWKWICPTGPWIFHQENGWKTNFKTKKQHFKGATMTTCQSWPYQGTGITGCTQWPLAFVLWGVVVCCF